MRGTQLDPDHFPVSLWVSRLDTLEPLWAVCVLRPPPGAAVPLLIPPVASDHPGIPMAVTVEFADGHIDVSGPWTAPAWPPRG